MSQRSGRILILNDDGQIVARLSAPLLKAQADRGTDRLGVTGTTQVGGVPCAARPFDMDLYAFAYTVNTFHRRACAVKARDIVGRGWDIVAETERDGDARAWDEIQDFFKHCQPNMSLTELLVNVEKDYQALGNGYLEVRRDAVGRPAGLEHYPAPTMYIRTDGLGFVHRVRNQAAYLKRFGDPEKRLVPGTQERQHEMIHLADYDPTSPHYGLPCIMPAFGRLALMQLELEYNSQFFSNSAMGRWAVMLEGSWEDDSEDKLKEYFQSKVKGSHHQTLVLTQPDGTKVTFQRLDFETKDSQFRFLRQDSRDEILQAHGVPPLLVGIVETGALGGNVGSEQLAQYRDSIVLPGQERWTEVMNRVIQAGWPGCGWVFQLNAYSLDERQLNAQVDQTVGTHRVLTPNEVRARRFPDLEELPELPELATLERKIDDLQKALVALMDGAGDLNAPGRAGGRT